MIKQLRLMYDEIKGCIGMNKEELFKFEKRIADALHEVGVSCIRIRIETDDLLKNNVFIEAVILKQGGSYESK